jgi:exonuclease SbcD
MRILHFADLHIGVENYGRIDPSTGFSTRLMDFLAALDEVVEFSITEKVDLVLLAGDAYKNRDPSQTQQRELAKRLSKISEAGIPIFLLVGNHDLPHGAGKATSIDIFDALRVPNIYIGNELKTFTIPTPSGLLQIVSVPWPKRSQLLTREETRRMSIDEVNERIQYLFSTGIKLAAKQLDPNIPAILTGHLTVSGAKLGSERSMILGQDHFLMPSDIHLPEFDYIALGHIHRHQILRDNPLMVYAGSLQRVDFGEEGDEKGFCVIDLDTDFKQGGRLTSFTFHQVKARDFVTIDVKIEKTNQDPNEEVLRVISRHNVIDAIVRVRIDLDAEHSTQLDENAIRQALSDAHFITSIARHVKKDERRTRIPADLMEKLSPMKALGLYLDSHNTDPSKRTNLINVAKELIESELSDSEE